MSSPPEIKPGQRVQVAKELGFGYYIEQISIHFEGVGGVPTPRILLDTGKVVYGYQVWWIEATEPPQAFEVQVLNSAQMYRPFCPTALMATDKVLTPGTKVTVIEVASLAYDHRDHAAAKIIHEGAEYYILLGKVNLQPLYTD